MGRAREDLLIQAWAALKGATWAILDNIGHSVVPGGASAGHMGFLHILNKAEDPITPGALATQLGVTAATATGALNAMEKAGLITRTRAPDDRRAVRVTITAKGRSATRQWVETIRGRLAEVLGPLSDADLALLADLLGRVAPPIHGPPPGVLKSMRHDSSPAREPTPRRAKSGARSGGGVRRRKS